VTDSAREPTPGWLLDETAHAGRENLDPAHAATYDAKEDAGAHAEVALLQEHGALGPDKVVVDLGTGTGQFTEAVAPACGRVVAVDVSPVMLAPLRERIVAAGLTNVEVVEAGFLTYEHTGPPADVVYSRYALHHLPDLWKVVALTRIRRMLRPGGLFRLSDIVFGFDPAEAADGIEAWCASVPAAPGSTVPAPNDPASWTRADLEEHVRDEHSTYTWLLEPMLDRAGFTIVESGASDDKIVHNYLLI
jgi:ubiquinone/menaquinone biosynthesis C-methylase UbiE